MINAIITYLEAATSSFKTVTHASDQKPVDVVGDIPILAVFPGMDSTEFDPTDNVESKMVDTTVIIHIVCLIEDIEDLKDEVRAAFMGWSAGESYTDMTLLGGELLELKSGICWWEEKYTNRRLLRAIT